MKPISGEEIIIRIIIVMALVISLATCARMQPIHDKYNPPVFPSPARLYFDLPDKVYVSVFSDENCTLGEYGTLVDNDYYNGQSEVEGYRARYAYEGKMNSINIEPNKPQVVNFTHKEIKIDSHKGIQLLSLCPRTYLFTPQDNHEYVAVYQFTDNNCAGLIIDLTKSRLFGDYVIANGLRPARENCDIYEYYSQFRAGKK